MKHLVRVHNCMFGNIPGEGFKVPYVMLQEHVTSNAEVKVIFVNRQFSHCCNLPRTVKSFGKSFSQNDVVAFAYQVLESISHLDELFILDGIVRVDIFKANDGRLVVNELESLEADFYSKSSNDTNFVSAFLRNYWKDKLFDFMLEIFPN